MLVDSDSDDQSGGCQGCAKIRETEKLHDENGIITPVTMPSRPGSPSMSPTTKSPAPKSPVLSPLEVDEDAVMKPELVHSLSHASTVLTLAVSPQHETIYAGTQDGEIVAWSLDTFNEINRIQAHKRSVLSLSFSTDYSLLFSSAGDPIISVWDPKTLCRLYEIYSSYDVGDIFCTAYSPQYETLYIGAQNASIQWIGLKDASATVPPDSQQHPDRRNHRFFDSKAVGGTSTPRRNDDRWGLIPKAQTVLEMHAGSVRNFAHYGYIFSMIVAKGPTVEVGADEDVLISGAGDGTIKLWSLGHASEDDEDAGGIQEIMTLGSDDAESVLSLALDNSFLYAGKLDGIVELWDLDTAQRLRVIKAHDSDIMALQMSWGYLWTAASNGWASKYSTAHYGKYKNDNVTQKYKCLARWQAHQGKILASAAVEYKDRQLYFTGSNDANISIWTIRGDACAKKDTVQDSDDLLLSTLRDFISYKTISSRPEFSEDCRKGATYLGALFKRLGGHVEMLSAEKPHNPVVYAKFSAKKEAPETRKKILFYGHYDVVAADGKKGNWTSDPFTMHGTNGFLYGRGVSDNKGPIIAALYAVTDLIQAQKLENDVIFLIEGEEEFGSLGFEEAVKKNKKLIGDVDYILLANSYWLNDEVPCLTYGLRGVLHTTVCVDAPRPDIHSGVDGSYMLNEPLSDLTQILSKLKGSGNRVQIPGFYDGILEVTAEEEARYDEIASILIRNKPEAGPEDRLKQSLMARWREPNLTLHRYKVSGPDGSLVSSHASAHISVRLVPGQELQTVIESLTGFLQNEFGQLESQNRLTIEINNKAEPWLGDPTNDIFRTLEEVILETWEDKFAPSDDNSAEASEDDSEKKTTEEDPAKAKTAKSSKPRKPRKPLFIREGGSIPAIRYLEKEFGAPAAHLPCGLSTDSAHLDNERMSLINLLKAREIFAKVFARL